jgi:hypothetical protein
MSRFTGNDQRCPVCGVTYGNFRTGLSYQDVFERLKDYSEDPSDWTYKRRGTVLGKWHQYKQELWKHHLDECEQGAAFDASSKHHAAAE